ncbi:MAG TPA: carboxypeptidase-like regulatory domain-containing protein, partial [Thermoanaerobaculia bacterium]|nr:carboxypeptidase-like regulatory domain-containing protein [Thermoanaerobaculia bacterium]
MNSRRAVFTFLILLLAATTAVAQTTASLTGTATIGGTPTEGITVTVSSPNLLGVRTTVTDANGNYNVGALPPGDYNVRFELEGMKALTKSVRVGLAQIARADADLQLTTEEVVTVTATSPLLETTEVQTNIRAKLIEDLPIGRTLIATVNLSPGVTQNGPGGATVISGAP